MPIYEYECRFCSHKFELLQKINDPIPTVCPNCGKEGGIHKLISEASFELKGSGWYVTDYKKEKQTQTQETEKSKNSVKKDANKSKEDTKK